MRPAGNLCAVDGCTSNRRRNKNLTFFRLPANEERRKKWTELIGRPDLVNPKTNPVNYTVCSLHFERSMIMITQKLQLRPDALPTKLPPSQPGTSNSNTDTKTKETWTQTNYSTVNILSSITIKSADMETEAAQTCDSTDSSHKAQETQIAASLSSDTPRKRRLSDELKELKLKKRKLENDLDKIRQEIQFKESEI